MKKLISALIACFLAVSASAATIYVDANETGDYPTIQDAIYDANNGDEIVLLPGIYTGDGNRDIDFLGKAITVRSVDPNDPCVVASTVIDCNGTDGDPHRGFAFDSEEDANTVLAGLTITGGYAYMGGAIFCYHSSPTITNCVLSGNTAEDEGGAIAGWYGKEFPAIINCTITGNTGAGAVWGCNGPITNCTVSNNSGGGLISCDGPITNCTITGNLAFFGGGLAYSDGPITNCTISGNSAEYGGGLGECDGPISNCIIWNNVADNGSQLYHSVEPTYSCIQDWSGGGAGNIDLDPCFIDPGYWDTNGTPTDVNDDFWVEGDYHLLPESPCINAGDPNFVAEPNETDLDGLPRVIGERIDMGAYEFFLRIEVAMRFTPKAMNPQSKGNWLKAHIVLPEGFSVEDVDTNEPVVAQIAGLEVEASHVEVFVNDDGFVEVEAAFERAAFCSIGTADDIVEVTVEGQFTDGHHFYGTDTIRIIINNLKYLAVFASYWLESDCSFPNWCAGLDLNQDSIINFIDFVMFDSCCIEVLEE